MGFIVTLSLYLAAAPVAPDWSPQELKQLLSQAQAAARAPDLPTQNRVLLQMAAAAYRANGVVLQGDVEAVARSVLRQRAPDHPNVKKGQWLTALLRQFYDDAWRRCRVVARFSRDRHERVYFERMQREAQGAADQLAQGLQLEVKGLPGFSAALAVADGDPPYKFVSQVRVDPSGAITVDGMERIRFRAAQPPADAERTTSGALRKLSAAFVFFNRSASTLGKYDPTWAKKKGHVQVVIPARAPAVFLNEVARAAQAAHMRRMHVMVMTKRGELRELPVDLAKPKKKRRRKQTFVGVSCADDLGMSQCARRIAHARKKGRPLWAFDQ